MEICAFSPGALANGGKPPHLPKPRLREELGVNTHTHTYIWIGNRKRQVEFNWGVPLVAPLASTIIPRDTRLQLVLKVMLKLGKYTPGGLRIGCLWVHTHTSISIRIHIHTYIYIHKSVCVHVI